MIAGIQKFINARISDLIRAPDPATAPTEEMATDIAPTTNTLEEPVANRKLIDAIMAGEVIGGTDGERAEYAPFVEWVQSALNDGWYNAGGQRSDATCCELMRRSNEAWYASVILDPADGPARINIWDRRAKEGYTLTGNPVYPPTPPQSQ